MARPNSSICNSVWPCQTRGGSVVMGYLLCRVCMFVLKERENASSDLLSIVCEVGLFDKFSLLL